LAADPENPRGQRVLLIGRKSGFDYHVKQAGE
jgi:hypothetical protein